MLRAMELPKDYEKIRQLSIIIKASYAILKCLNDAILNSRSDKEARRLVTARRVLTDWMKHKKLVD